MPITHRDLMLATSAGKPFSKPGWIFEPKYDGYWSTREVTDQTCTRCGGCLWVCEEHPLAAWDERCAVDGCDSGCGIPCVCNPEARIPPGFTVLASRDERKH